jgi:hypothetical protein
VRNACATDKAQHRTAMPHEAATATPQTLPATPPQTVPPTPRVLLLTVWLDAAGAWQARVVTTDGQVHDFASPFLLAQFLARPPYRAGPRGIGLR